MEDDDDHVDGICVHAFDLVVNCPGVKCTGSFETTDALDLHLKRSHRGCRLVPMDDCAPCTSPEMKSTESDRGVSSDVQNATNVSELEAKPKCGTPPSLESPLALEDAKLANEPSVEEAKPEEADVVDIRHVERVERMLKSQVPHNLVALPPEWTVDIHELTDRPGTRIFVFPPPSVFSSPSFFCAFQSPNCCHSNVLFSVLPSIRFERGRAV